MGKGFAQLGDKLADKKVACRVRGCPRTWLWRGHDQAKAFAQGQTAPPSRMCDLCHARAQAMEDKAIPCATPGCEGTSTWGKLAQLEAIMRGASSKLAPNADAPPVDVGPPKYLCDSCRDKASALGDKQIPCRMKGCQKTWTWTGKAQLAAGADAEGPSRMCDSCHETYEALHDAPRRCKVRGCHGRWTWTRWQQLEAKLAGRTEPPERMCDDCAALLKTLADEEIACRTDGCAGTWTWTRAQKLDAQRTGDNAIPARMCPSCQSKLSHLVDRQVPCKRSGCRHAWLYKRGAQLERWVKQGEGPEHAPPQRLCDACRRGLDAFHDREVSCKNEGCKTTWTWTRFAQLQARETGHGDKPPAHVCEECREFLTAHHTKTLTCTSCGASTHWAPELQLRTKLGIMREPELCASCKRKQADVPRRTQNL